MLPGLRSKHVDKIWRAMRAAGVLSVNLEVKGVAGPVRLTEGLLIEFLVLMRGNHVDQLMGTWIGGIAEIAKLRASGAAAKKVEGDAS